jgi:hypothetical protein
MLPEDFTADEPWHTIILKKEPLYFQEASSAKDGF